MTVSLLTGYCAYGQPNYPYPPVDQSATAPSPNAQSFESYGAQALALFAGTPGINIPIYTVKCGSIVMPISLSYNYNGLNPLQDAGWTGLGWNVNAGGVITRTVEGKVDGSQNSGYNYGEYSILDSLQTPASLDSFLQRVYNPYLSYPGRSYDLAPDIYDAEFNGYSAKFVFVKNKAYLLSYSKEFSKIMYGSIGGVNGFTITMDNGTQYFFSKQESTQSNQYGGNDSAAQTFVSAWYLGQVISADTKDTIYLNYTSSTWQQAQASYQSSYTLSGGTQASLGYDPTAYYVSPKINSLNLSSITCRNSRVAFQTDPSGRTDVVGSYPRLKEIDVIDSLTGNTVKKNMFSYEYFGQRVVSPALYSRLALKRFNTINPQLSSDSLTYTFKYAHEYDTTFPAKGTFGVDYWGYYNGAITNTSYMPGSSCIYYNGAPITGAGLTGNMDPNSSYSIYGILDTIVYPAGGYTALTYEANQFSNGGHGTQNGPGLRLKTSSSFSNNPLSPQAITKNYLYLLDDGATPSGNLGNIPNYVGIPFVYSNNGTNSRYTNYVSINNSAGLGGLSPIFFYTKVSETMSSGSETHLTDHYFTSYSSLFPDIRETKRTDYINTGGAKYIPLSTTITNYITTGQMDSLFYDATVFIDSQYSSVTHVPHIYYAFIFYRNSFSTEWVHPNYQQQIQYDNLGNSVTTTTNFYYDSISNNVSSVITSNLSDGQSVIKKFKYPEDYSSGLTGNMVSAGITTVPIETQTWLYKSGSDSVLISGSITQYDQTVYKPINSYAIETTKPITSLNNETKSSGKFSTLLSDSRYILKGQLQYDGNNNLSVATKASDMNVSYLWDYHHSNVIAQIKNAAQTDVAATSFESDGKGNWSYTGSSTADTTSPTGSMCYNVGQTSGSVTKSSLTSSNSYIVSYWAKGSALSITGTVSGYPLQGKTINGWTYFEHKITGQTSVTVSASGTKYIDELRLYPYTAQMTTYTFNPLIGISTQCDPDNRITYYKYDPFARLHVVLDQDRNIIKTIQYHTIGETNE